MSILDSLRAFADLLQNPSEIRIPEAMHCELLQRGAIAALEDLAASRGQPPGSDGLDDKNISPVGLLYRAAEAHPNSVIRADAFHALTRLAAQGNQPAVDFIYLLAVEADLPAARQILLTHSWQPSRPALSALFDWFTNLSTQTKYPSDQLDWITQAYLDEASPALRKRLLATAAQVGMENWAQIVSTVGENRNIPGLVKAYPAFSAVERQLTLSCLEKLAQQGSQAARDAICQIFIHHEDAAARQKAHDNGIAPEDPVQRALFFFLSENWTAYDTLDFNHSLIINAFEGADRPLRRRLLDHSRYTGRVDWLRSTSPAGTVRWVDDLTDADWELSIRRLSQSEKYSDLWRLAKAAPPVWSAAMLDLLDQHGWQPENEEDRRDFPNLVLLARESLPHRLFIRPKKVLPAPADSLNCIAIHPGGQFLAAGSGGQHIYLWDLPQGDLRIPPLIGPAAPVRALAVSADGGLLACAAGDHRIRVFRLQGGQILKTLEGHRSMIRSLALQNDGRVLYSAGFDGSIRFWRFPSGPELKILNPAKGEIFSMTLSADNQYILSGGADGLVRVWALPEGREARVLAGHQDTVTHLAASPAGDLAASAGRDGAIRLWNFTSGSLLRTIENPHGALTSLVLHPNDQALIGGYSDGKIALWSLSTGRMIEQITEHNRQITGLALSPSGDALYSSDAGGKMLAWDLRTFLTIRLPGDTARPGAAAHIQDRIQQPGLSNGEKAWLKFSAALARWRQKYDIELGEAGVIQIGEFDIEIS